MEGNLAKRHRLVSHHFKHWPIRLLTTAYSVHYFNKVVRSGLKDKSLNSVEKDIRMLSSTQESMPLIRVLSNLSSTILHMSNPGTGFPDHIWKSCPTHKYGDISREQFNQSVNFCHRRLPRDFSYDCRHRTDCRSLHREVRNE